MLSVLKGLLPWFFSLIDLCVMESSWSYVPEEKGSFLGWELKTPSNFTHQGFEELGRITSSNSVIVGDPNAFSTREQQLSNTMGENNGYNSLIDLKLGRFIDHGDALGPTFTKGTNIMSSSESSTAPKRVRASGVHSQIAYCQVYGCNKDLSGCKDYHKRHKVCEVHSKTSKVIVNGIEQRFCQQCSRFHLLAEFDDGKRSCRKRLAGHNERRRKPQMGIHSGKAGRLLQPYGDGRFHGTMLSSASFICQEILPSGILSSEKYGTSNWWRPIKAEDGGTSFRPLSSIPITNGNHQSRGLFPSYSDKQFPFLHENASTSTTGNIFCENNGQYPHTLGNSNSGSQSQSLFQDTSLGSDDFNVFDTESTVQGISGISDGGCALSLLSSQSHNSSSQSSGIHMARPLVIPNNHSHYNMSQVSEKMMGISSQASSGNHLSPILISDSNEFVHFEMSDGIFQGSGFVNMKDSLSCDDGPTIDLLQLSSQLQRVEHHRQSFQVKQENDSSCSLRIT